MRTKMQAHRVRELKKIESAKNKKIKDATLKHEKKYQEIKDYYFEITNTNLDIIRFLKEDLQLYRHDEQMSIKDHAKKQKENKNITEPLRKAKQEKTYY